MGSTTFKVIFDGDTKGLGTAVSEADGHLGKFKNALGDTAKIAAGMVLGNAITAAPGFLMDAAKAAAEDEQATARLEQTIKNLGGNYDSNLAKVNAAILAGEKLAFTDDEVRDSFQTLAIATGDTDEALQRQKVAMDLARGANIPLATATRMLSKVNEENVEAFKKLGITIGDNATEADALAAVQAKFAGQSDAYAQSTAGQFEIAQIRMAEAKETIGTALLPVMIAAGQVMAVVIPAAIAILTPAIAGIAGAVQFVIDNFDKFLPLIVAIGVAIGVGLVVALSVAIPMVIAYAVAWAAAAIAVIAANLPLIAIIATIALLAAGVVLLIQHWDTITEKFPILGTIADEVKAVLMTFADWITGTFVPAVKDIYETVSKVVTDTIAFVRDHWDEIRAIIEPALNQLKLIVETVWKAIQIYIETTIGIIRGVIDVVMGLLTGDWDRAWGGVKQIAQSAWDGIKALVQLAIDSIDTTIKNVLEMIKASWELAWTALKSAASNAWSAIQGAVEGPVNYVKGLIDGLVGKVDWAIGRINDLLGKIGAVGGAIGGVGGAIGGKLGFAEGVRNFGGGWAWVGEEGPELTYLPRGTSVFPADQSAQMAAGRVVNITQNIGTVIARNEEEARRAGLGMAHGLTASLRARGAV